MHSTVHTIFIKLWQGNNIGAIKDLHISLFLLGINKVSQKSIGKDVEIKVKVLKKEQV